MKTIHFSNGKTLDVSDEIVSMINESIAKGSKFQAVLTRSGEIVLIINLYEITYIA
jgi:hypothetical protein